MTDAQAERLSRAIDPEWWNKSDCSFACCDICHRRTVAERELKIAQLKHAVATANLEVRDAK